MKDVYPELLSDATPLLELAAGPDCVDGTFYRADQDGGLDSIEVQMAVGRMTLNKA